MKFDDLVKLMEDEGSFGSGEYLSASENDPGSSKAIYLAYNGNKKQFKTKNEALLFRRDNPEWEFATE